MRFLRRTLEPTLRQAAREFPAVLLTGPRQSGKTTLLREVFGATHRYVSLELPDVRLAAEADPRGFLAQFAPPVIFDEIQHAAGLLPYVKEAIDQRRDASGQWVLTGSQNLLLSERVTESLAGRAAILKLLPLSTGEILEQPHRAAPWAENTGVTARIDWSHQELWRHLLRGAYPELVREPERDASLWQASYTQTYIERDIRTLRQVGDLTQFQSFLRMVAARSGQLLSLSDVSRDLGVAVNTVKAWLSVLEAGYQVAVVRPFFANIGKRLVKTPKVYLTDTGTLCHLTGLKDSDHAASGPLAGAIFETAVFAQLQRAFLHRGEEPRVSFWRTSTGSEVDFLVETQGQVVAFEVKASGTARPAMAKGIEALRRDLGDQLVRGYVVYAGDQRLPLAPGVEALPFSEL